MAHIRKQGNSWNVQIRKTGFSALSASFMKKEDAELWAAYKEDLYENMRNFDPPLAETMTLLDAINFKYNDCVEKNLDAKTLSSIKVLIEYYSELVDKDMHSITYDDILNNFNNAQGSIVARGGRRENGTGHKRQVSVNTLLSRLRALSSVFSHAIERGCKIPNVCTQVIAYIKKNLENT